MGQSATINVASYFSDPDGDALTFAATSSDAGVASVALSGSSMIITGVSEGTATVTVTARDPAGLSATLSAATTVEEANLPPVALVEPDSATMGVGETGEGDIAEFFLDPDGDPLTFSVATTDASVVTADLDVSYVTIVAVGPGTATVTFTASDPHGQSASIGLTITVFADDHTCRRGSETPLAMGDSIPGRLLVDDEDCFVIEVRGGGGGAPFRLTAYTEGDTDTEGVLFDSNYDSVSHSDDEGEGYNFQIVEWVDPGRYYVRVTGWAGEPGEYLLKVDDHGDSPATATPVADSARGSFARAGNIDFFEITVSTAGELEVTTTGGVDTHGTLYAASGDVLATDDDGGQGANFLIRRQVRPGAYFVGVRGSASGQYMLQVAGAGGGGGAAHSCARGSETPLAMGDSVRATLPEDGEHCFAVQVGAEGGTGPFRLTAYTEGGIDAEGELYDSNYNLIADDSDSGERFNFQIVEPVSAGRYIVRVTEWLGRPGEYLLKVDDHGDSPATATPVADSARGSFARAGNIDFFEIAVSTAGELEVTTTGGVDTHGTLYDRSGDVLATDDDGGQGTNFLIRRQVRRGVYHVRVRGSSSGSYVFRAVVPGGGGGSMGPDLVFTGVRPTETTVRRGGTSEDLVFTLANLGDARSAPTTVRAYESSDSTISTSDTEFGSDDIPGGRPGQQVELTLTVRASSTASLGTSYVGLCVDPVAGESNTDNNCSPSVRVTVVDASGQIAGDASSASADSVAMGVTVRMKLPRFEGHLSMTGAGPMSGQNG